MLVYNSSAKPITFIIVFVQTVNSTGSVECLVASGHPKGCTCTKCFPGDRVLYVRGLVQLECVNEPSREHWYWGVSLEPLNSMETSPPVTVTPLLMRWTEHAPD